MYGFFRFTAIEQFFEGDGDTWDDSVDFTELPPRALALIERYRCGFIVESYKGMQLTAVRAAADAEFVGRHQVAP